MLPDISGSSIILVGSFNAAIFQPQWFAKQQLLSQEQADTADIKVIAPQVSQFETEQIIIQVTEDRFAAFSKPNADPSPLKDLVYGTFSILEHTPAKAMGLNRQMHFALESESEWHGVGDRLAPKDAWEGVMQARPGLRALSIESDETGSGGPKLVVRVEPSAKVKFGVYFDLNVHYQAPADDGLQHLMKILFKEWEAVPKNAARIAEHVLRWARPKQ
jgi:hypothetical protein